jgi:hypothetical protein
VLVVVVIVVPVAMFMQPVTLIIFISFSTSSNHPFHGFPTERFPSGLFLNTFFRVLSSGILSTCPNYHSLLFLISQIISGSLYKNDFIILQKSLCNG